jgi:hypothetical protein
VIGLIAALLVTGMLIGSFAGVANSPWLWHFSLVLYALSGLVAIYGLVRWYGGRQ